MGGIKRRGNAFVYHSLTPAWKGRGKDGKDSNDAPICCWHCCDEVEGGARACIPIPRLYDNCEGVYYVYGATCSVECAKAYVMEHSSFDRGQQLHCLSTMMHEVYGIKGDIVEAPPRACLVRFGGIFLTPLQERKRKGEEVATSSNANRCVLVEPPFVSYTMLAEERDAGPTPAFTCPDSDQEEMITDGMELCGGGGVTGVFPATEELVEETHPPSLFDAFLENQGCTVEPPPAIPKKGTSKKKSPAKTKQEASRNGPLSRFMRSEEDDEAD
jgi:hypothetical protein